MCLLFVHMGHHTAIKGTLNNGVKIQTVEPGKCGVRHRAAPEIQESSAFTHLLLITAHTAAPIPRARVKVLPGNIFYQVGSVINIYPSIFNSHRAKVGMHTGHVASSSQSHTRY